MPTDRQKLQNISFYILLTVIGCVIAIMFWPFFKLLALGGILAVLFTPLKIRILKYIQSETLASLATLILAILIILIPVYVIGQLAFNEVAGIINNANQSGFNFDQSALINRLPPPFDVLAQNILNNADQTISGFINNAFSSLTSLASHVVSFVVSLILIVFSFYYFLKDGEKFHTFVAQIFPLSKSSENLLVERLDMAIKGVVQGSFSVALLQGTVSCIGFFIFGVPQPLLWGMFTVLASLVPTVGTLLSLVPAVAYLFLSGHTAAGVGLAIWAWLSIQGIDNFISPRLIGYKVNLHPLVALLSILGGIGFFGYLGFLIGPILMAIFMTLLDIYKTKN